MIYIIAPWSQASQNERKEILGTVEILQRKNLQTLVLFLPQLCQPLAAKFALGEEYSQWKPQCEECIENADTIIVLSRFTDMIKSEGSKKEIAYATKLRKPIVYL